MSREYGRKPYVDNNRYPEFIQNRPAKGIWDRITELFPRLADGNIDYRALNVYENSAIRYVKQSEFKKPYGSSDDYQFMENDWEGLPGFRDPDGYDLPQEMPTYDPSEGLSPTLCVLFADPRFEDCWCPESTLDIEITGSHKITDLNIVGSHQAGTVLSNIVKTGNVATADLYADENESGFVSIEVEMDCGEAFNNSRGSYTVKLTQCADCPEWFITLTRGDGTTISASYLDGFYAKGKTSGSYHTVDYEYLGAGEWHVWVTGATGYDTGTPEEYYLSYKTKFYDAGNYWSYTQYPSRYQDSEKEQSADAVGYGTLSDTTAWFEVTSSWATTPVAWGSWPTYYTAGSGNEFYPCAGMTADNFIFITYAEAGDPIGTWRSHKTGGNIRWESEVSSNIDYSVRMYSSGTTGRRVTARGKFDADWIECALNSDCSNYWDYDNTYGDCVCDLNGVDTTGAVVTCTGVAEYFQESVSVVETVSDGLDANTYGPGGGGSPVYTFAAYDDTVNITSPSVSGKTHYFEYSIEADDIPFEFEDDNCAFGSPNCGDGAAPSTCCDYSCDYFVGGIDNSDAAYLSAINLTLSLIDITLAPAP